MRKCNSSDIRPKADKKWGSVTLFKNICVISGNEGTITKDHSKIFWG